MGAFLKQRGVHSLIFVALLVLFNWPVLSIPDAQALPLWLLGVWTLAIALLWLASRAVPRAGSVESSAPPPQAKPPASPGGGVDV